jgi:hypothetical protein
MTNTLCDCYLAALGAMELAGPGSLLRRAQLELQERGQNADVSLDSLCDHLAAADLNDQLRKQLHVAISRWDIAPPDSAWASSTAPRSADRRAKIYERLGVSQSKKATDLFSDIFPLQSDTAVIISDEFEPWYSGERRKRHAIYWPSYRSVLVNRGWSPDALAGLDEATTSVVERLTDPLRVEARQAKGLVVGYVQSGKTANFTGVVAKAIDAGYRLIIVLTGTIDVLRKQTQRRIDMELVGKENIIRGIDPNDAEMMAHVDYQDDPDWETQFASFGFLPSSHNYPDVVRLTSREFDYKSLRAGIVALEFEKIDKTKPLYDMGNLPTSSARIVVVKKNKAVLQKLVKDLKAIKTPRNEIPALVIDDESDQASVNTTNPDKWRAVQPDHNERTAINKSIAHLLELLPRAQYVGYTATPFANVFVDPSDVRDIFPKDFLISLRRPAGYMGVSNFHDIGNEVDPEDRTVANSNEKAYVRDLIDGHDRETKLREAIDAFVLSGAIKLYRAEKDGISCRHHTMLVHASVQQKEHAAIATIVRDIWKDAGYGNTSGLARLRALYESDFLPVSKVRAGKCSYPEEFDDLKPYIAAAVAKVTALHDPVIVVNGDKEMASEDIDFDRREVWRILVGGTKLSRGFTVEGLTVSYYRRKAKQADTLLQMGRWFGFRKGYEDLVRLYIGRAELDGRGTIDLYEAFDAIVRDEEAFRQQLEQYAVMVDGRPQITPKDIPPLVSQHLPWLKPAARNKMFNAELVVRRSPGSLVIPTGYPVDAKTKENNYAAVAPLFIAASSYVQLVIPEMQSVARSQLDAWIGEVDTNTVLAAINGIKWITPDYYQPDKAYLDEIANDISGWVVIAPQIRGISSVRKLPGIGSRSIHDRKRKSANLWGEPTDRKHRPSAEFIAGAREDYGDPVLGALRKPNTGALLVYPIATGVNSLPLELTPRDVVLAVAWIAPASLRSAKDRVVQFRAKNRSRANEPIVEVE